jgi:hypothetical protein
MGVEYLYCGMAGAPVSGCAMAGTPARITAEINIVTKSVFLLITMSFLHPSIK